MGWKDYGNPTTGSRSTPVAATAYHQQGKPSGGDGTQRRHGPPCGTRRQYQLEERDGIAKTLLQSAQRAISAVGDLVEFVSSYRGSSLAAELFFIVLRESLAGFATRAYLDDLL
jgi:hypothetical protein